MLVSPFILKPYLLVGAMSGYCEISRTPVDSSSADHAPAMRGKCSGEGKWEIFLSDFLWFSGPRFPYLTRASASNLPRSSRQVSFAATVEKNDKFTFQRLVSSVPGSMIGLADFICLFDVRVWMAFERFCSDHDHEQSSKVRHLLPQTFNNNYCKCWKFWVLNKWRIF